MKAPLSGRRRWLGQATLQAEKLRWLGPAVMQAAKTALAAGLSWFVAANLLGNNIPVFAPLAALLTVQVTVWESVSRGLQRVVGVVVGVLVAYGFARLAGINAWSIALVIFVSLLAGRALRLGQQGSIQVPVSALLVLALGAATSGYAIDRVVDTALGAGMGIVVNLVVVPRTHLNQAQEEMSGFARALGELIAGIATQLPAATPDWAAYLDQARRLSDKAAAADQAVRLTETETRWNPSGRRDRAAVVKLRSAVVTLGVVDRATRGIARTLSEGPAGRQMPAPVATPLSDLLLEVAGGLEPWAANLVPTADAPGTGTTPARVADLYLSVLVAARSPDVSPEAAAIASAIAVDARRINGELHSQPEVRPTTPFSWHTLFGP